MITTIIKRSGEKQPFEAAKVTGWGEWAAKNLGARLDWPSIVVQTVSQMPMVCTSENFQKQLIRNCILTDTWSSNRMAGRLYAVLMRKQIFGSSKLPSVREVQQRLADVGYMRPLKFSEAEYEQIEAMIDHERDFNYPHFQLDQLRKKYALRDRTGKQEYETPQFIYMRMAMALGETRPGKRRMIDVQKWYDFFSLNKLNPPTPNYVNLGTHHNGYASCCLYTTKDTVRSLAVGDHIAYTMTYMSAGIGNHLNTRSLGESVRNGLIEHQGKLPYYTSMVGAVRANKQNGRAGALNSFYSVYDPEVEVIARLKNPMSPEDRRIRGMDYTAMFNKNFARHVALEQDVFLFNSQSAPDLYQALFSSEPTLFDTLFEKYKQDESFPKQWISARELLITLLNEAYETGRNYEAWIDEINRHTPYKDPIHSSNLCVEITEPTAGYDHMNQLYTAGPTTRTVFERFYNNTDSKEVEEVNSVDHYRIWRAGKIYNLAAQDLRVGMELEDHSTVTKIIQQDPEPEVALCSIAGIIVSNIVSDEEYAEVMYYGYLMIDICINISDYELPHIGYTARARMAAGMGMMDLAHHMARLGLTYDSQAGKDELHRVAERHAYFAVDASLRLGQELGNAPWIHRTKWAEGWLPIDTYNRNVDNITSEPLHYPWEALRARMIANGGIRNSALIAFMPGESSSKGAGVCNSIYPVREDTILKTDNGNIIYWAAPNSDTLQYQYAWDIKTKDMFDGYAIFQKFTDQAISADEYRKIGPGERIGTTEMIENFIHMTKHGIKTRYYLNSHTAKEVVLQDGTITELVTENVNDGAACAGGGCAL